jgi:hypothetical protein
MTVIGMSPSRDASPTPTESSNQPYPRIPPPTYSKSRTASPARSVHHASRPASPNLQGDEMNQDPDELRLPNLWDYVPKGTEKEYVQNLHLLFESHYGLLKKYLRHLQLENFFDLFGQLHGLMTVPVRRLLEQASVAEWIRQCDITFYEHMIRMMSQLATQVMPEAVIAGLRKIRDDLVPTIENAFKQCPPHVLTAKIEPAKHFARLFDRLIRLNRTTLMAASALQTLSLSDVVYRDWARFIDPLNRLSFQEPAASHMPAVTQLAARMYELLLGQNSETETVLDPWIALLQDLPEIFATANGETTDRDVSFETIKDCVVSLSLAISGELLIADAGKAVYLDWGRIQMWLVDWVHFESERESLKRMLSAPSMLVAIEQQRVLSRQSHGSIPLDITLQSVRGSAQKAQDSLEDMVGDDSAVVL